MRIVFGLLAAALVLTACATDKPVRLYDGAERPRAEIAVLVIPNELDVLEFDDESLPMQWGKPAARVFHVTPGPHEIKLRYWKNWPQSEVEEPVKSPARTVRFEAAPGQRYHIEPPMPRRFEEAVEFVRDMDLRLVPEGG